MWHCSAIDHAVTIYPHGKIGPCCRISADYLKPISEINNPNRFQDLKTDEPPKYCVECVNAEAAGRKSYRDRMNDLNNQSSGLQIVDIRNTNLCNLKCRYCGPHYSNQWALELNYAQPIQHQSITDYKDLLLNPTVHTYNFAGGEPLINPDHWLLLQEIVEQSRANTVGLVYTTNLTTLKYKNISIEDLWSKFKSVEILVSIDATGAVAEQVRSNLSWDTLDKNLQKLKKFSNVKITLAPVLSILNFWNFSTLIKYAKENNFPMFVTLLRGPDFLSLDVMPDELKQSAIEIAESFEIDLTVKNQIVNTIKNNANKNLIQHTISHILTLDKIRNENLFDSLPLKNIAMTKVLEYHDYK